MYLVRNTDAIDGALTERPQTYNTIFCSPPYFDQRDYESVESEPIPHRLWDADPHCDHDLQVIVHRGTSGGTKSKKVRIKGQENFQIVKPVNQLVCSRCSAWEGAFGRELSPDAYVRHLVEIFSTLMPALRDDGVFWLNLGDSYAGSGKGPSGKSGYQNAERRQGFIGGGAKVWPELGIRRKELIGIPWMVAFALRQAGWYIRNEFIWEKPNALGHPKKDTAVRNHETIFQFVKRPLYWFDFHALETVGVTTPLRRGRTVLKVPTSRYKGAHFATYPPELIEPFILASTPEGGLVLDPFAGSGTTLFVAERNGRNSVGYEIVPSYCALAVERIHAELNPPPKPIRVRLVSRRRFVAMLVRPKREIYVQPELPAIAPAILAGAS